MESRSVVAPRTVQKKGPSSPAILYSVQKQAFSIIQIPVTGLEIAHESVREVISNNNTDDDEKSLCNA